MVPAAVHQPFVPKNQTDSSGKQNQQHLQYTPTQIRWSPFDVDEDADWTTGLRLLAGAGDAAARSGSSYYIFTAGRSMAPISAFYSADGDLLIIPQQGVLDIKTELGHLLVQPKEICVIPRGIRYRVELLAGPVRGYALELHQGYFTLPNLGPIGSFGLANVRDFQIPHASFEDEDPHQASYQIYAKFNNGLHVAEQDHTPFDVVAWHGTYYPFKYDLGRFLTIGSISYDHPDPSIFTLLSSSEGVFEMAIFPPRWLVMEDTFRPPWYHRNTMSEFMGLIEGEYDARTDGGFRPGGASLHNTMAGHGPDSSTHKRATEANLVPEKIGEGSMAFVIESNMTLGLSEWAIETCQKRQLDYGSQTWGGLRSHFEMPKAALRKSNLVQRV